MTCFDFIQLSRKEWNKALTSNKFGVCGEFGAFISDHHKQILVQTKKGYFLINRENLQFANGEVFIPKELSLIIGEEINNIEILYCHRNDLNFD